MKKLNFIVNPNIITIGIMFCAIASFYGAGFSNIAPLLADKYSMQDISKIHGIILSAWGVAGLTGNMMTTFILIIIGIIIALMIENSIEITNKKIFYLVLSFILAWPIACIFEYLGAVVILIWKTLTTLFKIWF